MLSVGFSALLALCLRLSEAAEYDGDPVRYRSLRLGAVCSESVIWLMEDGGLVDNDMYYSDEDNLDVLSNDG